MKIAWIADFTTDRQGGSQITDSFMINYGKQEHEIDILGLFNINNLTNIEQYLDKYNKIIVSNFIELAQTEIGKKLFAELLNRKFIRYIHDYDGLPIIEDNQIQKDIYNKAQKVIFLSPLHKKTYLEKYKLNDKPTLIIPPYINVNAFKSFKSVVTGNLLLGEVIIHKGIENVYNYLVENDEYADWYTWNTDHEVKLGNVTFKPSVSYSFMPILFNTYETFIHLPEWIEPFGRTVAEAFLTDIKLETNKNVGFLSYNWDMQETKENLMNARFQFWKSI